MSARSGWLRLLVPDERGRRAVEETFSDWREDVARAPAFAARLKAHADGLLSFGYLAAGLFRDQSTNPDLWRSFLATFLIAAGLALAVAASMTWLLYSGGTGPFRAVTATAWLAAMFASMGSTIFGIVGAAGAGSSERRPVPAGAMVALCFAFSVVWANWIAPALSFPFFQQVMNSLPPAQSAQTQSASLLIRFASLSVPATYYLLGATVRLRLSGRSWRARQAWGLAAVLAVWVFGLGLRMVLAGSTNLSAEDRAIWGKGVLWMSLAVSWCAILVLARRSEKHVTAAPAEIA